MDDADQPRSVLEFRLLGPVEVVAAGRRLDAGPPRQRSVLAVLAADAGRVVPVPVVIDRVWGDDAPAGARRTRVPTFTRPRRPASSASRFPRRGPRWVSWPASS